MMWTIGVGLLASIIVACGGSGSGGSSSGGTSSPTGVTATPTMVFPSTSDPVLATFALSDGRQLSLLGTKDAGGLPTSILSARIDDSSLDLSKQVTISYDGLGRPLAAKMGDGGEVRFQYSSPRRIVLTIFASAGVVTGTLTYDPISGVIITSKASSDSVVLAGEPIFLPQFGKRSKITPLKATSSIDTIQSAFTSKVWAQTIPRPTRTGSVSTSCALKPLNVNVSELSGVYQPNFVPSAVTTALPVPFLKPITGFSPTGPGAFQYTVPDNTFADEPLSGGVPETIRSILAELSPLSKRTCDAVKAARLTEAQAIETLVLAADAIAPGAGKILRFILTIGVSSVCAIQTAEDAVDKINMWLKAWQDSGTATISASHYGSTRTQTANAPSGSAPAPITINFSAEQCSKISFTAAGSDFTSRSGPAPLQVVRKSDVGDLNFVSSIRWQVSTTTSSDKTRAVLGEDYTLPGGQTVTFPVGQSSAQFTIPIQDNPNRKEDRVIGLELFNPTGAQQGELKMSEVFLRVHKLTVRLTGLGREAGKVLSTSGDIDCEEKCEADVSGKITLSPGPLPAHTIFKGWAGDCTGTGSCEVDTSSSPKNVEAKFDFDIVGTWNAIPPLGPVYTSSQYIFYADGNVTWEAWGVDSGGNGIQINRPVLGAYTWRIVDNRLFILTNGVLAIPDAPGGPIVWAEDHWEFGGLFTYR